MSIYKTDACLLFCSSITYATTLEVLLVYVSLNLLCNKCIFFQQHYFTRSNWRNYMTCTIRNNNIQLAEVAEPYIKPSSYLDWCISLCFLTGIEASILKVLTVISTSKLCIKWHGCNELMQAFAMYCQLLHHRNMCHWCSTRVVLMNLIV